MRRLMNFFEQRRVLLLLVAAMIGWLVIAGVWWLFSVNAAAVL